MIKSFSVSSGVVCWQFFVAVGIQNLGLYIMSNVASKKKENNKFKLVNRKPIIASDDELTHNHRAHSAKLRVIERVIL